MSLTNTNAVASPSVNEYHPPPPPKRWKMSANAYNPLDEHHQSSLEDNSTSYLSDENEQTWIEADVADQGNCEALRIRRICAVVERECNCGPMRARQLRLL